MMKRKNKKKLDSDTDNRGAVENCGEYCPTWTGRLCLECQDFARFVKEDGTIRFKPSDDRRLFS